jgi:hypothetical protein
VFGSVSFTPASQLLDTGVASLREAFERQPVEMIDLAVDVYRQSEKVPPKEECDPKSTVPPVVDRSSI